MIQTFINRRAIALLFVMPVIALWSCNSSQGHQQGAPPIQPYKVMEAIASSTVLSTEYPASLKGIQDIEIRPKIDGYIESVLVDEGAVVKKGQLLFKIKNPTYEEDVRNYKAAIVSAEADVASAELEVRKAEALVAKEIISPLELESNKLTLQSKVAALAQAKANLANAQINVGYTAVTSPVNGIVGTLPYKLGSYVSSSTSTALTTVSDISKVYAYFSLNEKQVFSFFTGIQGSSFQQKIAQLPPVTLVLADGTIYKEKGKIETISGQVDATTGSYNVRAGFVNNAGLLRSGNSATVKIPTTVNNAILVPQSATYELQGKRMVYVVGKDSTIKAVEVQVREVPGGKLFVADKGVAVGDKLLLEGAGILTEGTRIAPVQVSADSVLNSASGKGN